MKKLLLFFLILFIIPISITSLFFKIKDFKLKTGFNHNEEQKQVIIRVLKDDNTIEKMNIEDYLVGVVSSEVPVTFEKEALKAQAVASRTYALKQIENNKNKEYDVTDNVLSQVYSNNDKLKERWGNNFDSNYKKIKDIVEETKGEYISYNNDYIYAFFFSTSNGKTEDNKNVFGEDLPYLKVVDSSFDENETTSFLTTKNFNKTDFYNMLGINYSDSLYINNIERSESNRILSLSINGIFFKGRDFQKKLSLRSNDFEIKETDDEIIINTRGFGHGVGMSQYGANALAKKNKSYKEIIKYYYQGTEIKKL